MTTAPANSKDNGRRPVTAGAAETRPAAAAAPDLGTTLVICGGGLGDVLFHLPFIRALQPHVAGEQVILACKKAREMAALFAGADLVGPVVPLAKEQDVSGRVDLFGLRRRLADVQAETAVIFHPSATLALAVRLAGIRRRVGYHYPGGKNRWLLTDPVAVARRQPPPPFFHRGLPVMAALGLPVDASAVHFRQSADVVAAARARLGLAAASGDPAPMIALGVNASTAEKQWGGARFAALAERLLANTPARLLLFGAPDVAPVAAEVLRMAAAKDPAWAARIVDLTAQDLPAAHSHALLQDCRFYIGNDSFGLNLAAMASLPAVGIFIRGMEFTYSDWIVPVVAPDGDLGEVGVDQVWQALAPHLPRPG